MSLNAYDQYEHLENRLTHALAVTLERCPGLKKFLFKEAGCIGRIGLTKKCRVVLQLAAGQIKEKQNEEECGIPDLTISDDKGNAIIVESKVGSGLRWQQLASHENRARRNELRVAFGLAITGRDTDSLLLQKWLSERRLKCPWKHITWRQIYRLACKFDSNPWIRELRDYMQLVAEQLDQNHMEVGVKIVDFRGVPFMGFQDYEVGQAKRVLKALMDELREDRQFLHDLGFTKNQMPQTHKAIKNSLSVWDFLSPVDTGKNFTDSHHFTVGITQDFASAMLTIPHASFRNLKRYVSSDKAGEFEKLIYNFIKAREVSKLIKQGARPYIVLVQRRYRYQRLFSVDGELVFDLRALTGFPASAKEPAIKPQPEWLDFCRRLIADKQSNIQFQIGMRFPYSHCQGLASATAVNLFKTAFRGTAKLAHVLKNP
jgi:hypothetical protein